VCGHYECGGVKAGLDLFDVRTGKLINLQLDLPGIFKELRRIYDLKPLD
jgi:carbonic anhydrase